MIALISMHLLLDILINFYKNLRELKIPNIGGIVRFEKRIMISTSSNMEEEYISINKDKLLELKNKGIKPILNNYIMKTISFRSGLATVLMR